MLLGEHHKEIKLLKNLFVLNHDNVNDTDFAAEIYDPDNGYLAQINQNGKCVRTWIGPNRPAVIERGARLVGGPDLAAKWHSKWQVCHL